MKLYSKGYIVKVTSYIGDADHYRQAEVNISDYKKHLVFLNLITEFGNLQYQDLNEFSKQAAALNLEHKYFYCDSDEGEYLAGVEDIYEAMEPFLDEYSLYGYEDWCLLSQIDSIKIYKLNTDVYVEEIKI